MHISVVKVMLECLSGLMLKYEVVDVVSDFVGLSLFSFCPRLTGHKTSWEYNLAGVALSQSDYIKYIRWESSLFLEAILKYTCTLCVFLQSWMLHLWIETKWRTAFTRFCFYQSLHMWKVTCRSLDNMASWQWLSQKNVSSGSLPGCCFCTSKFFV